jgi:D-glycero-alpha-D-manno-heptose-7-phosphate kinase
MIIVRTPFRVSLFGGGTDFPTFFRKHGSCVIGSTIDKYCYLTVHKLATFSKHRFRAAYSRTEHVDHPDSFQHPLIREVLLFLAQQQGIDISHIADLPAETGLGSSSAFTVGLLHVLHAYRHESITPEQLATEAIHIELDRVGGAGGWQDQYFAAYGGLNRIDFQQDESVIVTPLTASTTRIEELYSQLMLFYTDSTCPSKAILQEQNQRTHINEAALLEMKQLVMEAECILNGNTPLTEIGLLLDQSWKLKQSLAPGISNSAIDNAYAAAKRSGATGGKLLGAGGRGFLCLFVDPHKQQAVRETLGHKNEVLFNIAPSGSEIIFNGNE